MTAKYVMALDCGGGTGRCMLLALEGGGAPVVSGRAFRHPVEPNTGGWGLNLDTAAIWRGLGEAAREVMDRTGAAPEQVVGIAATGMRHGAVLIDSSGLVLWGVANRDARAAGQAASLAAERGAQVHERTGHWPSPIALAARLLWLREHQPALLQQARAVLSVSDWVSFKLCDRVVAERSQASASALFGLVSGDWEQVLLSALGLPLQMFGRVVAAGQQAGELTKAAAAHLGLKAGIPVAVGGADTQCALLGSGAVWPGDVGVIAGTTLPLQQVTAEPIVDCDQRLWTGHHLLEGCWVLESNAGAGGQALQWLADLLFAGQPLAVPALLAEARGSVIGARGITSPLGAQLFNAGALGLPVSNLTLSHLPAELAASPRCHVARATLEGLAYAVRANLEQLVEVSGHDPAELRLAGGLSRSRMWGQLVADVCSRPVRYCGASPVAHEASLLGAAICAAVGGGHYEGLEQGVDALVAQSACFEPGQDAAARYAGLFDDWQTLRRQRSEANETAAQILLAAVGDSAEQGPEAGPASERFAPKILVTAPLDETALERLGELGEVSYAPYMQAQRLLTGEDLVEALEGVHVFVTEVDIVDAEALAELSELRAVMCCRASPVNVDVEACTAFGIPVIHAPGRNAIAVAELTLALLLVLSRKIVQADRFLHEAGGEAGDIARMGQAHERFEGFELRGKTIGLVGLGLAGQQVATVLGGLGVKLLACDPFVDEEQAALVGARLVSLDELLRCSDAVSLHAAVSAETRGLMGAAQLAQMKPGALLVNTARAALIDEDALLEALRSGRLAGAALDVFALEPPGADHPLLQLPQVVATPHVAGNTIDVARHQGAMAVEAVESLLAGNPPARLCNPATLEGFRWMGPRRVLSDEQITALANSAGPAVTDLEAEQAQDDRATDDDDELLLGALTTAQQVAEAAAAAAEQAATVAAHVAAATVPSEPSAPPSKRRRGLLAGLRDFVGWPSGDEAGAESVAPEDGAEAVVAAGTRPAQDERPQQQVAMQAIIESFLRRVVADEAIAAFSKNKKVTVRYQITDLPIGFHMCFVGHPVRCALGAPPHKPELTLKMKAQVFDDVMTERISGMKAAMSGQMAFSGNTMKAMSLQRIQKDLNRCYQAARDEVGDPGDLNALSSAEKKKVAIGTETAAAPIQAPAAAARPARSLVGDERDEMVTLVEELYGAGLLTSTGGNVSMRRASHPEQLWITPSAMPKGQLGPEMLVRVDLEGEPLDDDSPAPSSERLMHCTVFRDRPDVHAVIHSHAPKTIALGLAGLPFLPISTEAAFFGEIPRVEFRMPGTEELAEAVAAVIGNGAAVMLLNHGLLVAGSSLRRAVDLTHIVEETSMAILDCHAVGRAPPVLPDDVLEMLRELGELIA